MSWTSLKYKPGMVRDSTRYAASGTWYDGSLVRFREGYPEKWAGWRNYYPGFTMVGMCRSIHRHGILNGTLYTSFGTSQRFYMASGTQRYDVTPVDEIEELGANPLSTTNGSNIVTVTDAGHLRLPGNSVILSGATATGGLSTDVLNAVHQISSVLSSSQYTIEVSANATSTATGGGSSVTATYLYQAGGDNEGTTIGTWGDGGWGEYPWGGEIGSTSVRLGMWSQDNWGEDLVANPAGGPIFYWDATNPSDRMVNILDLAGADNNAPTQSEFIIISHVDRHLLAFGVTAYGSGNYEPMTFRWCSQENILNWDESDTTGTAGSLPLSNGSRFVAGIATAREILVWTDQALYSIQYVGAPFIYTSELLERWSDICGQKACCSYNGAVYWMGTGGFYVYNGRTEKIPCPVWDYVSTRMDRGQTAKVYASSNQNHNEVIWYYQSINSTEIDSYVALDIIQGTWTFGSLSRTAWIDLDSRNPIIAVGSDGKVYEHDFGTDDGSTIPSSPMNAFIESGPIEISSEGSYDKGDKHMFIRRIFPDITFRSITTTTPNPTVMFTLKMMDKPGGGVRQMGSGTAQRFVTMPVEQFTDDLHVRLRGRSVSLRIESNTLGTNWRLGIPRLDVRPDGGKSE